MQTLRKLYNEPKKELGLRPPLFDRLVDENPTETTDTNYKFTLSPQDLMDSIQLEVSRILNTRLTAKNKDYEELTQDPLNFGLPSLFGLQDFQSIDGTNPGQWRRIASRCQQAISKFEPRLNDVKVKVHKFNKINQSLEIHVTGSVLLQNLREIVQFPILLESDQI